ncbi:MAG: type II toxin-antitoxin system Phd/YefM family antitoxin [Leptodesmis sp.]|uniref:type II toxin-antitoxin system Phd/YefM family antitoxin n=1 Tax=Leptodesmis TaxID=2664261 RepID=UPI001F3A8206|nr:type II toxin-antitoxin system Phd/YefM family antitoxin [Leptodesmis sichuanensis]UIE37094.1 type II toxin-antitoxin system Phd/YefM family antitoxin [Leptodesmis sichuanensis A121]
MSEVWQLQTAKNKFSEVVEQAIQHGPQVITRRGNEVAVVLSYADYRKLTTPQTKLSVFFRESPLAKVELDLTRDVSAARDDLML